MVTTFFYDIFEEVGDGYNIKPDLASIDIKIDLNQKGLEEDANWNKLAWALINKSKVERLYREEARNAVPLEKYMKAHKEMAFLKGCNDTIVLDTGYKVKYSQTTGELCGRLQANGSISMQGMVREVRHLIASDSYVDVDVANCHPVITEWICDNIGVDCAALKRYINERENIFEQINNYSVENGGRELSRGFLKVYMLKISYGCGDKSVDVIKPEHRHPFINEYVECMRKVGGKIMKLFASFYELNKVRRIQKGKKYNFIGSGMSHLCQYVENQILMKMYTLGESLHQNGKSILCFDGIMIHKSAFSVDFNKDSFMKLCESYFHDKGFLSFKLEIKDMNYGEALQRELAKSAIVYKPDVDYVARWLNNEHMKRIAQLKEYAELFKDTCMNSVLTTKQRDVLMEEVGGFEAADFRIKLENTQWVLDEFIYFYKAFGHMYYARMEADKSKYLIHLDKKGYQMGDLPFSNIGIVAYEEVKQKGVVVDYTPVDIGGQLETILTKKYPQLVRSYNKFVFHPYTPLQPPCKEIVNKRNFNVFTGYETRVNGEWLKQEEVDMSFVEPLLYHLKEVLCAGCEESFQFMLKWCQILFKEPRRRTRSIPVFVSEGEQVGGKGTFFNEFLSKLILGDNMAGYENGLDFLSKNFNPQLEGRLLTVCEEATTADGSFHSLHAKLKSQSTESLISINDKNVKAKTVENYNNFVVLSNYDNCVKLEDNEKRFVLFKTSEEAVEKKGGQVEYFNWLYKYINKESALHFYFYIYHLDLSHVDMRVKPRNDFYNDVKEATASNQVKFAREVVAFVKNKLNPVPLSKEENGEDNEMKLESRPWVLALNNELELRPKMKDYKIKRHELYEVYRLWCLATGVKNPVEFDGAFATTMKKYVSEGKVGNSKFYFIR